MIGAFQDALVALATHRSLRKQFQVEPQAALASFQLSARETSALIAIPFAELDRYAKSLEHKRWREVARVIPRTLKIAPSLAARYRDWLSVNPAPAVDTVLSPGVLEALRAMQPMYAALSSDGDASYAPELFAYEVYEAASRSDGIVRMLCSRFALHEIVRELSAGTIPIDPDLSPHTYRFERYQVRHRSS